MTVRRLKNVTLRLWCLLALTLAVAGCIQEETADCEEVLMLTVRAYDASYAYELPEEDVKDVTLFIFDKDDRFLRKMETGIGRHTAINAPSGEEVRIVAWGNLTDGAQTCAEPSPGDPLDGCFVGLKALSRAASEMQSPGDLFRGSIILSPQARSGEVELPMFRETGSMAITIRSLKTFAGYADDDYSVVVRETRSEIGFDGVLSGDRVAYRPQGTFNSNGEFIIAPFNLLPESGLYIDIYHGTQLLMTVSKDSDDRPLAVEKGRLTNVLIDLKASLSVSMSVSDWGDTEVWKEF